MSLEEIQNQQQQKDKPKKKKKTKAIDLIQKTVETNRQTKPNVSAVNRLIQSTEKTNSRIQHSDEDTLLSSLGIDDTARRELRIERMNFLDQVDRFQRANNELILKAIAKKFGIEIAILN